MMDPNQLLLLMALFLKYFINFYIEKENDLILSSKVKLHAKILIFVNLSIVEKIVKGILLYMTSYVASIPNKSGNSLYN